MGDAGVTADDTVLCERRGAAGLITLNRPKALNASPSRWCGRCAGPSTPGQPIRR